MEKLREILSPETFGDFVRFLDKSKKTTKNCSNFEKEDLSRHLRLFFQEKTIQDGNFAVLSSANAISPFVPEVPMSKIIYLLKVFGDLPNYREVVLKTLFMNEFLHANTNTVKRKLVLQSDSCDIPAKVHKNGLPDATPDDEEKSCEPERPLTYDFSDCFNDAASTDKNLSQKSQNDMMEPMQIDNPIEKPRSQEKHDFDPFVAEIGGNFEDEVTEASVVLGPEDREKFAFLSPRVDWAKKTPPSNSTPPSPFGSSPTQSPTPTVKTELDNNNFQFELSVKLSTVPKSPKQFQTSPKSSSHQCYSNNATQKTCNKPHTAVSTDRCGYSPAGTSIDQFSYSHYCKKSDADVNPIIKRQKFFYPVSQPQVTGPSLVYKTSSPSNLLPKAQNDPVYFPPIVNQSSEKFINPPVKENSASLSFSNQPRNVPLKIETDTKPAVESNNDPSVSEIENRSWYDRQESDSSDDSNPLSPSRTVKKVDLQNLEEIFSNIGPDTIRRVYDERGDFELAFNELSGDRFSDPHEYENRTADKYQPYMGQTSKDQMILRSNRVLNQKAAVQPSTEGVALSTNKTDRINDNKSKRKFWESTDSGASSSVNVIPDQPVIMNLEDKISERPVLPIELPATVTGDQRDNRNDNDEGINEAPVPGSSNVTVIDLRDQAEAPDQPHSSSSKPAVEQSRKVDERILFAVAEMFPSACPQYLRSLCKGLKYDERSINKVISEILSNENYPKRSNNPEEAVVELDLIQQWEMLKEYLPDADPEYLRRKCDEIGKKKELLEEFINDALERRNYPKLKDYLRKQQLCSQVKQYTEDFSVEKFLKIIPNPKEAFKDPKRIIKMDAESVYYVTLFLKNHFSRLPVKVILGAFNKSDRRLLPTVEALENELTGHAMKSKRKSIPLSMNLLNIPLLQEIAYIQHKEEIELYIAQKERTRALKRQLAKDNGLMVTCGCCYDEEVMPKDVFNCDKGCSFCGNCVKRSSEITFADAKIDFPCLGDCSGQFSLHTLQEVLEPKLFSKIAQKKALNEVKAAGLEDLEMCPFCDFASIPPEGTKVFQCLNPECMKESCRQCKETSHIPLKCEEVERDAEVKARTYIENKMTDALLRECYKCKLKFYKEEGCNKMTCSCGAQMCYVCKQPVKDYKHFNGLGGTNYKLCPLYSDTNSQNARDVLKGAEEAKATIGAKDNPEKLKIDPAADIEKHFQDRAKKLPQVPPVVVHAQQMHYMGPANAEINRHIHLLPIHAGVGDNYQHPHRIHNMMFRGNNRGFRQMHRPGFGYAELQGIIAAELERRQQHRE